MFIMEAILRGLLLGCVVDDSWMILGLRGGYRRFVKVFLRFPSRFGGQKAHPTEHSEAVQTTFDDVSTSVGLANDSYEQKYHLPEHFGSSPDIPRFPTKF